MFLVVVFVIVFMYNKKKFLKKQASKKKKKRTRSEDEKSEWVLKMGTIHKKEKQEKNFKIREKYNAGNRDEVGTLCIVVG